MSLEHQTQLEKVEAYYDKAQKFYRMAWDLAGLHYGFWFPDVRTRRGAINKENEALSDLVDILPGDVVLDAGCGIGGSANWLNEKVGAEVIELNVTTSQLAIAKGRIPKGREEEIHPLAGDYQELPLANGSVDVIWSLESIEHADDPERFIQESFRVLRGGGRIVVAGTFAGKAQATAEQGRQMEVGKRAAGAFNKIETADKIRRLMEEAGFEDTNVFEANHLVKKSARQMTRMCKLGLPFARLGHKLGIVSQIMVDNTQWGTYQEGLFDAGVTSYNVVVGKKR